MALGPRTSATRLSQHPSTAPIEREPTMASSTPPRPGDADAHPAPAVVAPARSGDAPPTG